MFKEDSPAAGVRDRQFLHEPAERAYVAVGQGDGPFRAAIADGDRDDAFFSGRNLRVLRQLLARVYKFALAINLQQVILTDQFVGNRAAAQQSHV